MTLSVKVKKPNRTLPILKKDFYIDTTKNPSFDIQTNTDTRHDIKDILKKSTFVTVFTDIKGIITSDVDKNLRHHSTTNPIPLVLGPSGQEPGVTNIVVRLVWTKPQGSVVYTLDQNRSGVPN